MDYNSAISYNNDAQKSLWLIRELPRPYSNNSPATRRFAEMVEIFQAITGLEVDGKLGPKTLAGLKSSVLAAGMKEARAAKASEAAKKAPAAGKKAPSKKAKASRS